MTACLDSLLKAVQNAGLNYKADYHEERRGGTTQLAVAGVGLEAGSVEIRRDGNTYHVRALVPRSLVLPTAARAVVSPPSLDGDPAVRRDWSRVSSW